MATSSKAPELPDEVKFRGEVVIMEEQKFFRWVKRLASKRLVNISQVEKFCGIKASSLYNAVKKDQEFFSHAEKLEKFFEFSKITPEDEGV